MELIGTGMSVFDRAKSELTSKLEQASTRLGKDIGVGASEGVVLPDLTLTPLKPNTARSVATVHVAGKAAGDLYVIVFNQGDSTGEFSAEYPEGSLIYPEAEFSSDVHAVYPRPGSAMHPRPKYQLAEICIPLCSAMFWADREATTYYQRTELRILGLGRDEDHRQIQVVDGSSAKGVGSSVQQTSMQPSFLTLGTDNFGRRVGDPHAVFNPSKKVQIAGFLAAEEPGWLDLLASFDPVNPYAS